VRHFLKLADGVDIVPLLHALRVRPDLWNQNTLRTTHQLTPHKQVDDIWLRFNDLTPFLAGGDAASIVDEHESICYPAWKDLPQARSIIFDLLRRVEATRLGRVLITRMAPGKIIEPHEDGGSHAAYYERVHVVIQGLPGSLFNCGDETVCMKTGEVWWFDNAVTHSVQNNSADDRIHMIVDYRIDR
jgi:hypothetical protein